MRVGTVVASVAMGLSLLACSKAEPPAAKPEAAPPPAAPAAVAPQNPSANPQGKPAGPRPTTVLQVPDTAPTDYRGEETPCDRNEPGWKWTGNLVENGQCVVGPCDCVKG